MKTEETTEKDKTIQELISDYKLLCQEKVLLFKNKESLELKIGEIKKEYEKLDKKRIDLESFISNSGTLLFENKATTTDFLNKRQEHYCVLGGLDDQKAVEEICTAKLNDWPVAWRALRGRMQDKERELRHCRMLNLASEIASTCGSELKMLLALVGLLDNYHPTRSNRDDVYLNLGALLCSGIYGGGIRNTENFGYPSPDETAAMLQKFNEEIGIKQ